MPTTSAAAIGIVSAQQQISTTIPTVVPTIALELRELIDEMS
jgi:hypothetical protein